LEIAKRKQCAFKVAGLTRVVERSVAWLGFNGRLEKFMNAMSRHQRRCRVSPQFADVQYRLRQRGCLQHAAPSQRDRRRRTFPRSLQVGMLA
jgi:hypothetical protein